MDICTVQCPTAIWKSLDGYNTKNIIWISSQWTLQCIGEARIGGELWIVLCLNYADNFPSEQCILVLILWSFCCKPKIQERVRGASLGDCSYLLLYFHQLVSAAAGSWFHNRPWERPRRAEQPPVAKLLPLLPPGIIPPGSRWFQSNDPSRLAQIFSC